MRTKDAPAALKDVRSKLASARDKKADLRSKRDDIRKELNSGELSGGVDAKIAEAEEVVAQLEQADTDIETLQSQELTILNLLGQDVGTPGHNGPALDPAGADSEAVEVLKGTPGALLSAMLERRKADIPTLSPEARASASKFEMATPGVVTTSEISTTTETSAIIDLLSPQSVAMASGVGVFKIDTTKAKIPRFTELPEAKWIAEMGKFPISGPGLEMVEVEPPKVGLISKLSIEVFEDLSPLALAMIQTQILRAMGLAYDKGILFGSGENDEPLGVAKTPGIGFVEAPALTNLAAFAEAIGSLFVTNAKAGALVMHPMDIAKLLEAVEFNGETDSNIPLWKASINGASGLQLPYFNVPVWPTPACPQGEALMYDPSLIIAVLRKKADITVDPYYGFDEGFLGLRTFLRGDVVVGQPDGVVRIKFAA